MIKRLKQILEENMEFNLWQRLIVYLGMVLGFVIPILVFRLMFWQLGGITAWIGAVLICLIIPFVPISPLPLSFSGFFVGTTLGFFIVRELEWRKWEKQEEERLKNLEDYYRFNKYKFK